METEDPNVFDEWIARWSDLAEFEVVPVIDSAEVAARDPEGAFFDGPPILAVEILSPSDRESEINEKVDLYLEAGTAVVWLVDPHLRTITIVRPDAPPRLVAEPDTLAAEPHLLDDQRRERDERDADTAGLPPPDRRA